MGLFKNKECEQRKLKEVDEKINLIFDSGMTDLSQNSSCELAISGSQMIINPLSGPERKVILEISQINSVDVITWGEYARKYQHTTITIEKNSIDRTYCVINYTASNGSPGFISFWTVVTHWHKIKSFAENLKQKIPAKTINL